MTEKSPLRKQRGRFLYLLHNAGDFAQEQGGHGGKDDFGNHIHAVIHHRVSKGQQLGVEACHQVCTPGRESLLGEEPLGIAAEEDVAGEDVAQIPAAQSHNAAQAQGKAGVLNLIAEAAANTQDGEGQHIVQQAHKQGVGNQHAGAEVIRLEGGGNGLGADDHFQSGIHNAGQQSPLHAVAVGNQHDGEHAHQSDLAAEGHLGDEHFGCQLQDDGHGDEQRAFREHSCFGFHRKPP